MANNERMISANKLVIMLAKKFRNRTMVHYDDLMAAIADVPTEESKEQRNSLLNLLLAIVLVNGCEVRFMRAPGGALEIVMSRCGKAMAFRSYLGDFRFLRANTEDSVRRMVERIAAELVGKPFEEMMAKLFPEDQKLIAKNTYDYLFKEDNPELLKEDTYEENPDAV